MTWNPRLGLLQQAAGTTPLDRWKLSPNQIAERNKIAAAAYSDVPTFDQTGPGAIGAIRKAMLGHASDFRQGASPDDTPYSDLEQQAAAQKLRAFRGAADANMPGSSSDFTGIWKPFFQFHENASALASGRGNKYSVNTPTEHVTRTDLQDAPGRGDTYGVFSSSAAPAASARGGTVGTPSPYDLLQDPYQADDPNAPSVKLAQLAAMDALRNSVDPGNRARALPAEGTPDWYNRQDTVAAHTRTNEGLASELASNVAAGNYWRNQQPIDTFKHDVAQSDLDAANARALNVENVRGNVAIQKAFLALQGAQTKQEQEVAMAQLKALVSRANVGAQYGQDTSALDSTINGMTGVGTPAGAANIRQPMGAASLDVPPGTPRDHKFADDSPGAQVRDPDTHMLWEWDGRQWQPKGGR